jgi:hypothetical protein
VFRFLSVHKYSSVHDRRTTHHAIRTTISV